MAVDMFLKIADIKGESRDHKHKDEIDVLSWSWGMTQSATTHMGPGGGGGKVNVHDISLTKYVDKATPNLMKNCCNGKPFKDATLTVRKAGGKAPVEYFVLKLNDVVISALNTGGSGGQDRLTETVTLNFSKFHLDYQSQKADGSGDAKIPAKWDIVSNKEF